MQSTPLKLTDVKGIGESTMAVLVGAGVDSVQTLATASLGQIYSCQGFGPARAAAVQQAAKALLASSTDDKPTKVSPQPSPESPRKKPVESQGSGSAPPKGKKEKRKMAKKSKKAESKKDKKAKKSKKEEKGKKATKSKKEKKGKKAESKKGKKAKKK